MGSGYSITQTIGKRYFLHEHLGTGGMGTVHRATDRLTGQTVALKRVTTPSEELTFASKASDSSHLIALATEFRTLASLRHPNIISVLDYGFDESRHPFFTMEYLEDAKTIVQAGKVLPRQEQVNLILEILQALVYLHRRGILHRDLKPANVLVTQGHVKVVDFGLSVDSKTRSGGNSDSTAGTLAYMAPELFNDIPVSRASDLYAVGIISYELFAGRHPFNINNIAVMLNEILNKQVDVKNIDLDEELADVLSHLLSKDKDKRSNDAGKVIRELCHAMKLPLPAETEAIRESFLQSAKFVGRNTEISLLREALNKALEGHGSSRLIGGESGVGKSRLVEELRTLALVKGALLLRGQAISEGGRVYQLWRDMLPLLALLGEADDLEAGVLKPFVPNISILLDREVPDAPPLDSQAAQKRLFDIFIKLIGRLNQPVLIILEDLQWAGSGSIGLMNHLGKELDNLPLLLLGTYRDDEAPDLPQRLDGVQVHKLSRLDETGIQELSESILGENGRQPQIVGLLRRETEGIPFFLVEVVRALAENAGDLSQISLQSIPDKILAGGIEQIIQRRLNRIQEDARPLLRIAAVIGRELDLDVLQTFNITNDLEQWFVNCADTAVLEIQDNHWRFAHDKLREFLLDELTESERPALHQQAAEAIEKTYPDPAKKASILAYLWQVAGNEVKELEYAELAGRQELSNSVYAEGIRFIQRSLEILLKQTETPERAEHELKLLLLLGPALMNNYGHSHPIVAETYTRAAFLGKETQQTDTVYRIVWGLWANAGVGGNIARAREMVQRLFDVAKQTGNEFQYLEANHAGWSTAIWQGATRAAEEYYQQGMVIYDKGLHQQACISLTGHDAGVCGWSLGAMNVWLLGYPDRALERANKGFEHSKEIDHPFVRGHGLFGLTITSLLLRDRDLLNQNTEEYLSSSSKHGLKFFLMFAKMVNGWSLAQKGNISDGLAQMTEAVKIMHEAKLYGPRPLVLSTLMETHFRAGHIDQGLKIFQNELNDHPMNGARMMESEIRRLNGELLFANNQQQQAEDEFQQALTIARNQEAKSLELRAGMSLAKLWKSQKNYQEAHQMLSEIYNWFTEGFETSDLKDAKALLKELR